MILQALTAYYEQLLQKGAISAPGWDHAFNVSFYLVIDDSGRLLRAEDKRAPVQKGKKQVLAPIQLSVPAHVEHSSNIAPSFLCNNASYLLGADEKGNRNARFIALKPALPCTTNCWTTLLPPPPRPSWPFLIPGSPVRPRLIPPWPIIGRTLPGMPTCCFCTRPRTAPGLFLSKTPPFAPPGRRTTIPPTRTLRLFRASSRGNQLHLRGLILPLTEAQTQSWFPSTKMLFVPMGTTKAKTPMSANTPLSPTPQP